MNLINAINEFKKNKRILFTTPGHSCGNIVPEKLLSLFGRRVFEADISEIEGFDNIREPEGIFLQSQKQAAKIYEARQSFYLYNGSSSGIIALIMASVSEGEKILIARNCHQSAFNALVLSGAEPVWFSPEWNEEFGICDCIDPEKIREKLSQTSDIKAMILTSPTYEGVASDIFEISKICKEKNVALIVDEAHGALWPFSNDLPAPAILQGADASVQSLHKSATALTQGAILHLGKNSSLDPDKVQKYLNLINSTSPSYLILTSVEASVEFLCSEKGALKLNRLIYNINRFKKKLSKYKNIKILSDDNHDPTKLFISIQGMSGYELSEKLMNKFCIEDELSNEVGVLCLCTIGTDRRKLDKLKRALIEISNNANNNYSQDNVQKYEYIEPKVAISPQKAFNAPSVKIPISDSIGEISKELITPYPPGIPVLMPGEIIQKTHLRFLKNRKNIEIIKP